MRNGNLMVQQMLGRAVWSEEELERKSPDELKKILAEAEAKPRFPSA